MRRRPTMPIRSWRGCRATAVTRCWPSPPTTATNSTSASRGRARRSSLQSETGLFDGIYARGDGTAQVSDQAWLQAMLDVEAALARACAGEGLFSLADAEQIAAACRAERFDLAAIGAEAAEHAGPVLPLVRALRVLVGERLAGHVHLGATSQDVLHK